MRLKDQRISYWGLLITQVFLIILATFMEDSLIAYILFAAALIGIYGSAMRTLWESRLPRILGVTTGMLAISGGVITIIPNFLDEHLRLTFLFLCISFAAFILIAIIVLSRDVFVRGKVTVNMIIGSICIYLLIGMFFAFIYGILAVIDISNLAFITESKNTVLSFGDYLYYSYVALTTTGFGDVVATVSIAKTITILEIIVGPVYLAIMVARLVGTHISQSLK